MNICKLIDTIKTDVSPADFPRFVPPTVVRCVRRTSWRRAPTGGAQSPTLCSALRRRRRWWRPAMTTSSGPTAEGRARRAGPQSVRALVIYHLRLLRSTSRRRGDDERHRLKYSKEDRGARQRKAFSRAVSAEHSLVANLDPHRAPTVGRRVVRHQMESLRVLVRYRSKWYGWSSNIGRIGA